MVLDSSAIVALMIDEPEAPRVQKSIERAATVLVGAPTVLESTMVLSRFLGLGSRDAVEDLLKAAEAQIVPFGSDHAATAHEAFLKYGKGRHPAALNYGDCMAYAIAKIAGHALLFVGADFSQTDIAAAG